MGRSSGVTFARRVTAVAAAALLAASGGIGPGFAHMAPVGETKGDDPGGAHEMAFGLVVFYNFPGYTPPINFVVVPRKAKVYEGGVFKGTYVDAWEVWAVPVNDIDPLYATGTALPGSPFNASHASDIAITAGGVTVVGYGNSADSDLDDNTLGPFHAFRWTDTGGIVDLGTLPGDNRSFAFGISSDATTIVGKSDLIGTVTGPSRAFRIVGSGPMQDLTPDLPVGTTESTAYAVNADGSVVVGDLRTTGLLQAFRWVQTPGLQTGTGAVLGTLGFDSHAMAVSSDGAVVVGGSSLLVGSQFQQHAFRWDQANGMVDLGVLPGHLAAMATAVSDSGAVVVGISDPLPVDRGNIGYSYSDGDTLTRAFRWTEATGMVDLQQLMATRLDMSGIRIASALAISEDGRYISGEAHFDSRSSDPVVLDNYILCYADAATEGDPCPTGGITTPDAQASSLAGVQGSRGGIVGHTGATADLLLGATDPLDAPSSATALAAVGSLTLGVKARYNLEPGLTLFGGLAYADFDFAGLRVGNALAAASGLRYVLPGQERFRPFVEAGAWATPQMNLTISRTYMNGAGTATGIGSTSGATGGLYAEAGVIFDPTPADEVALSATLAANWLSVAGYTESAAGNPFPATFSAATDVTTSVKATLAWTHEINERLDATLTASVGGIFGIDPVSATIAGLGATVSPGGNAPFAELGARLGYRVSDNTTVSGFVSASAVGGAGLHAQVGVAVGVRF